MPDAPDPISSPPSTRLRAFPFLVIIALIGLSLSCFLLFITYRNTGVPGCPGGSGSDDESTSGAASVGIVIDCEHVLASRYSKFFSAPVSLPGAIVYLGIGLLLLRLGPRPFADRIGRYYPWLVLLVASAAGAGVWFVYLQIHQFHALCIYCMATHLCSFLLLGLVLFSAPTPPLSRVALWVPAITGAISVLLLPLGVGPTMVTEHITDFKTIPDFVPRQDTDEGQGKKRVLTMLNGLVRVKPADLPLVGSVDSPHIIVCLYDYTCPHCRILHHYLDDACDRFKGQIAVIPLAIPLDAKCNPHWKETLPVHKDACDLAKLGLVVYRLAPSKLGEFDRWMFEPEDPRTYKEARQHAASLVGGTAQLDMALADPWIATRLEANLRFYDLTGGKTIPKLISGSAILPGQPADAEEFFDYLNKAFGIGPPVATEPATTTTSP